jgi:hypothetical protein
MLEVSVSEVSWPKGMKVLENWRNGEMSGVRKKFMGNGE